MRECWVNVYRTRSGKRLLGVNKRSREDADKARQTVARYGQVALYRIRCIEKPAALGRDPTTGLDWATYRGLFVRSVR